MIKGYLEFINEKMGVPQGIVESATSLYELICRKFEECGFEELIPDSDGTCHFDIDLDIKITISDMEFSGVIFDITVYVDARFSGVDVASWGVTIKPTSESDYNLYHDKSQRDILNLGVNFISQIGMHFSDIAKFLRGDRKHTIGILSHELKHVYDKYKIGTEFIEDVLDYNVWSKTRTGFEEIDRFIYLLYVISKAESLVRPSEVAGYIQASNITKSEFKEFLETNRLWNELREVKNWSYNRLKDDLKKNIKMIRSRFQDIPKSETDDDVIRVVLKNAYESIVQNSAEMATGFLGLNNPIKILTNQIKEEDFDFFNKYIRGRVFKNEDEFFLFWEKKLNFEGEKVMKKIAKLFDMCKDEEVNPIMAKINDRVAGQCIVNPELWNKYVVGKKTDIKYPKK